MNAKDRPSVSFDELEDAMTMVRQHAASCYLHRSTGEIVMLFETDGDDALRERVEAEYDAYVPIPPEDSGRAYEHLVEFAESIGEDDVRGKLEVALGGRAGVFGRFRDVVSQYPDVRARFDAHMHERSVADVKAWLESEDLDLELRVRPRVAPPQPQLQPHREPDLIDLLMLGGKPELLNGKVRRSLCYPNEHEARAAFKRIARQIVEHCGHAWRKRYVEKTSELDLQRFRLVHDGRRVDLFVDTPPGIYVRFSE